MTLALVLIEVGLLLVYAGVKGKSVQRLLLGDNQTAAPAGQTVVPS